MMSFLPPASDSSGLQLSSSSTSEASANLPVRVNSTIRGGPYGALPALTSGRDDVASTSSSDATYNTGASKATAIVRQPRRSRPRPQPPLQVPAALKPRDPLNPGVSSQTSMHVDSSNTFIPVQQNYSQSSDVTFVDQSTTTYSQQELFQLQQNIQQNLMRQSRSHQNTWTPRQ